jgi:hypothetical protein
VVVEGGPGPFRIKRHPPCSFDAGNCQGVTGAEVIDDRPSSSARHNHESSGRIERDTHRIRECDLSTFLCEDLIRIKVMK